MERGQGAARWLFQQQQKETNKFPTNPERLRTMERVCRALNPNDIVSIRPVGPVVKVIMSNGTVAKIGCW